MILLFNIHLDFERVASCISNVKFNIPASNCNNRISIPSHNMDCSWVKTLSMLNKINIRNRNTHNIYLLKKNKK